MSVNRSYRATIQPIQESSHRPLWSVIIPTYNCANYLRETLASVLAQDPGPDVMQIEVIDDHSTKDDPRAVVEELGKDRVGFYQQPQNVGYIKNFETCLQRSQGKLVHLLHGDDRILYGFYSKMQEAFEKNPDIGAAFRRHMYMDEHSNWLSITELEQPESGVLDHWLERMASRQIIQTPSIVVRRNVYEKLGAFDHRITCNGEDWEMWVRIAHHFPVWYEVEPLALYRIHLKSLSGNAMRTGQNIRDLRTVIEIIKQYLPEEKSEKVSRDALNFYAFEALHYARKFIWNRDLPAASNQIQEALKCSSSAKVRIASLKVYARLLKHKFLSKATTA